MPIQINAHGFQLAIQLTRKYEDWLNCSVQIQAHGFSGAYAAQLQIGDFLGFSRELQNMYDSPGEIRKAVLNGIEPGISVELTSSRTGTISGEYEFNDYQNDTKLIGSFTMDQSFLPSIISDIKTSL